MPTNKDKNTNFQKGEAFGSSFGSSDPKLPNTFDEILGRLKQVFGVETDTDFARSMGFKQGSVSGAKQKQTIPPAWITEVALSKGISADWLLTGEGEMKRSSEQLSGRFPRATAGQEAPAPERDPTPILNDTCRRDISIADMLAKTARVLESDTVYREALYSNIEAFHHGVTMDERLGKMDAKFDQVMQRLDALEAENQQLRQELEHSRAQSTLSDTG